MATHDYNIANQGFPAFRADLNDALAAIVSNNSSATEPATTFAHQFWMDTAADPSILKVRNADNDAWITLGTFNQTADTFTPAGVTSDKIEEGNSKVEVVDTGTGYIVFEVDGAEVARFNPDQLVTKAGTASTPAVSPTGDLNTGIFFPAADTIAFAEGGAEAMRIDSSGNVGIGNTTPSSFTAGLNKLVLGSGSGENGMTIYSGTANSGYYAFADGTSGSEAYRGYVQYSHSIDAMVFATAAAERARITSDGNLLLGLTSSASKFAIEDTSGNGTTTIFANNGSFATAVQGQYVARSASSAYHFFLLYSGTTSDLEFNIRGDGNGFADGTWNNNGADYAEYFESVNGQPLTLGATVVLDGNKVREATDQDPASAIIGVVRPKEPSKASMVVGNTAWNKWANKYLTDDFDRYFMEDHDVLEWIDEEGKQRSYESHAIPAGVTVPENATRKTHDENGVKFQHYRLNPAWNPESEYVSRENRPEWNIIGLLGQVKILKGQPMGDRWIKMRDVSETVEEWMIR